MKDPDRQSFNERQKRLQDALKKPDRFAEAMEMCLDQHAVTHAAEISGTGLHSFDDELWEGLSEQRFRRALREDEESIAWNIWHCARIEDITMNLLVAGTPQLLNADDWLERLHPTAVDTGNAMTHEEVIAFSDAVDMAVLRDYRRAVGRRTRQTIRAFGPEDLKRKMEPARLRRVLDEGAVLEHEKSRWLVDFWGRKTVAGILLMPVTRHNMVHLNESLRLKARK